MHSFFRIFCIEKTFVKRDIYFYPMIMYVFIENAVAQMSYVHLFTFPFDLFQISFASSMKHDYTVG